MHVCTIYVYKYSVDIYIWASETSPTLGCSIEISGDIYCRYVVCLSYVKLTARNYVAHAHAQSLFWVVKPVR